MYRARKNKKRKPHKRLERTSVRKTKFNLREAKIFGNLGTALFVVGACCMDGSQLMGAAGVLIGLAMLTVEAKKEGIWR